MKWDNESMRIWLAKEASATPEKLYAYDRLVEWGESKGGCCFMRAQTPSFVVRIPTKRVRAQIISVRGWDLVFYSVHFMGDPKYYDWDKENEEFARASKLVVEYWSRLLEEFNLPRLRRDLEQFSSFRKKLKVMEMKEAHKQSELKEPHISLSAFSSREQVDRLIAVFDEFYEKRSAM